MCLFGGNLQHTTPVHIHTRSTTSCHSRSPDFLASATSCSPLHHEDRLSFLSCFFSRYLFSLLRLSVASCPTVALQPFPCFFPAAFSPIFVLGPISYCNAHSQYFVLILLSTSSSSCSAWTAPPWSVPQLVLSRARQHEQYLFAFSTVASVANSFDRTLYYRLPLLCSLDSGRPALTEQSLRLGYSWILYLYIHWRRLLAIPASSCLGSLYSQARLSLRYLARISLSEDASCIAKEHKHLAPFLEPKALAQTLTSQLQTSLALD